MTPLLIADDASEYELAALAAEQRLLAADRRWEQAYRQHWQRIGVEVYLIKAWRAASLPPPGLAGCAPGAGPERTLDFSWLRRAWNALLVLIPC